MKQPSNPWRRSGLPTAGLWLLLVAIQGLLAPSAMGQESDGNEDDVVTAPRSAVLVAGRATAEQRIELDGYLADDAWTTATPITAFIQQEPVEGGQPSEDTEIRIVIDEEAFYIGAMFFDDPAGILAHQKRRDQGLGTDDRFMWILDTFLDGRTGYFFEINPAGLMGDGLITGGGGGGRGGGGFGINKAWDGVWEARVQRLDDGWSAEIRIPFGTLNFNPEADTWGINFQRTIRRKNEEILWSGHRRNQGLFRPIHAGRLTGLAGMSQGIGLEVKPYAVAGWNTVTEQVDPTSYPRDIGFDVGYSITPSLRAAASVNTDFAEVEVDQRRVNLTRFPLRFPEQRDFFLEGSGVFNFAGRNGVSPYFSRRIGLRDGGAVPIQYGTRLGGQAGRFELGLLQVATEDHLGFGGEDFSVARVKSKIFEQSTIGTIYTRRSGGLDTLGVLPATDHTMGMDLDLWTSKFLGDQNLQFEAFVAWNSNPDASVDRSTSDLLARGFRLNFPNDVWQGHFSYREFGDAYDPAIGFVTRNGFRRAEPRISWRPRTDIDWIRRFSFSTQFRYLETLGTGRPEERVWQFGLFGMDFESGDNINVELNHNFEYLDNDFEISDGVDILTGEYANWEVELRGRTASRRLFSINGNLRTGGFWDGDRFGYQFGLDYRPKPGVTVGTEFERNEITLPQGAFDTNLFRLTGAWDISPWSSVTGNVQYDNVSEVMGLFIRARWILAPGNDLFIVYTQNWQNFSLDPMDRRFETISRGGSTKLNYTFRF
ncbi:MAG: DUF5916 domain-containing protein [Longimicrobiales bacterium]